MIDSHAHITSEFYNDIDGIIDLCKKNNIEGIVNCADSISSSKEILELSKKHNSFLFPSVGIHPQNAVDEKDLILLEELIKKNKIIAIGEIGLDYHYENFKKNKQIFFFRKQLDLAVKYNLPVIIHIRDSIEESYQILKEYNLKGVIHCYSGSYEMAKKFIDLGYYLGIGGIITFKNSKLYTVIKKLNLNNLLLETDSPFLTPEPFRGKTNNPSYLIYVATKIADVLNISVEEVIEITTKNTKELFKL